MKKKIATIIIIIFAIISVIVITILLNKVKKRIVEEAENDYYINNVTQEEKYIQNHIEMYGKNSLGMIDISLVSFLNKSKYMDYCPISRKFKNKFDDRNNIIQNYKESKEIMGEIGRSYWNSKITTGIKVYYDNKDTYNEYQFEVFLNDKDELDDLILIEVIEKYTDTGEPVEKKPYRITPYNIYAELYLVLVPGYEFPSSMTKAYAALSDDCVIVNNPNEVYDASGESHIGDFYIDGDIDKNEYFTTYESYDETIKKKWQIKWTLNDDGIFNYVEFIEVPYGLND